MSKANRAPDWGYWRYVPKVTAREAVALSLNIEPRTLRIVQGATGRFLQGVQTPKEEEFHRRLDVVVRNLGATLEIVNRWDQERGAEPEIGLQQFVDRVPGAAAQIARQRGADAVGVGVRFFAQQGVRRRPLRLKCTSGITNPRSARPFARRAR